jgi:hypothetical protein
MSAFNDAYQAMRTEGIPEKRAAALLRAVAKEAVSDSAPAASRPSAEPSEAADALWFFDDAIAQAKRDALWEPTDFIAWLERGRARLVAALSARPTAGSETRGIPEPSTDACEAFDNHPEEIAAGEAETDPPKYGAPWMAVDWGAPGEKWSKQIATLKRKLSHAYAVDFPRYVSGAAVQPSPDATTEGE